MRCKASADVNILAHWNNRTMRNHILDNSYIPQLIHEYDSSTTLYWHNVADIVHKCNSSYKWF